MNRQRARSRSSPDAKFPAAASQSSSSSMASRKQLSPLARHYEAEAAKRVAEVEAKAKAEREALVETMQLRLSDAQAAARSAEAELGKIKDATTAEIEEQAEKKWKGALRASVRKYRSQIKDLQAELDAAQAEAEAATSSAAGPNPAMMQLLAKQKAKSRAARETALAKQEVKLNRLAKQKSDVLRSSQKSLEQSLAKAKSQLALRGKSASRGSTGSTSSPANRRRSVDRAIVEHEKALRSVKAENEAALADLRKQLSRDVAKAEVKTRKEMMRKAKKLVATATEEESAVAETLRAALADGTSKLQSKTEELIQTHDAHAAALEMADREHLEVLAARIEESEEQLRSVHAAYEQQLVASSKATSTAKTSAKRHTEKLKSEHETAVEELRVTYEREVVAAAKKESLVLKRRQSSALSKRDAKHEAQLEGRIAELVAAHSAALVQQQKSSREAERKTQASANRRVSQAKKLASTAMEESDAKIAEFKAAAHKTNEEHLVTVRSEARRKSRLVLKRQGDAHAELLATLKNESTAAMEKVERELAQRHRKAQLKTNVQHKTERIRLSDELEESAHVASLLKDSIAATTKSAALALRRAKEELMLEKAMAAEHSTALDSVSSLFDEAKVSHAAAVQSLEETHAAEAAKLVASHNDVVSSVRLEHDAQESAAAEALVKLKEAAAAHELLISERDTLQDRHDSAHASAREAKVQHSAAVVQSALELSAVRDAARVKLARETSELAAAHSEIEAKRTAAHAAELNAALAEENARSEDAMAALVKTHESKVAKDARKFKNETTQAVRAAVSEVEKTTAASEAERHELLVKKHAGALRKLRREENSRAEARHAVAANKFKRELAEMEAEAVRGKDAAVKTLNSKHRRAVDHLRQDFDLTLSKELDDAADNHKRVLTEQKRLAEKSKAAAVHTLRTSMEQRIEDHELRTSSSTETKVALERKLKSVQAEYEEQLVAAEAAALSKQTSVDETERLQRELVVLRADTVRSQEVALDEYRAAEEEARNAMVENHANAVVKKQSKIDEKQSEIEGLQLQLEEETALQLELAATAEAERVRATDVLARAMKDAGAKFETRLKKEVRSAVRVAVAAQAQKHRHDKASSSSGAAAELDALRAELEEANAANEEVRTQSERELEIELDAAHEAHEAELTALRREYDAQLRDQSAGDQPSSESDVQGALRQQRRQVKAERLVTLQKLKSLAQLVESAHDDVQLAAATRTLAQMVEGGASGSRSKGASVYAAAMEHLERQLLHCLRLQKGLKDVVREFQAHAESSSSAASADTQRLTAELEAMQQMIDSARRGDATDSVDVDQRLMEAAFELEARERKLKRITQEKQALSAALARAEKRVEQLTTRRLDSAMDTPLGSGKSFPRSPIDPPPPPQFTLG